MSKQKYPNLSAEMAKARISLRDLAQLLDTTPRKIAHQLNGNGRLTLADAIRIHETYFPDMSMSYLFQEGASNNAETRTDD